MTRGDGTPAEAHPSAEATLAELRRAMDELQLQREVLDTTRSELETEREELRQLFHLAPDAYLVTDERGVIRESNRAAAALLHKPEGALAGRPLLDFLSGARRAALERQLRALGRGGDQAEEWELRLTRADGSHADVVATVAAARSDELMVGLRWLLRDVTVRKRAEIARRRLLEEQAARVHAQVAERRNAFLAEASEILAGSLEYGTTLASVAHLAVPRVADSCIVYVVEEDGRVERPGVAHADPAREAALRAFLEDRPFDPESLTGPVARALRTGQPELIPDTSEAVAGFTAEEDDGWTDADLTPCSLMVVPLRVRDRVMGALSLGWDEPGKYTPDDLWLARKLADRAALAIENARLHREARRASEVKSEFLAAMSHEFRTPLTAILAFAELLVDGIPEPISGAPRKHAEQILGAAKHMAALVDQVLTLSRLDAERERVRMEPTDLGALTRETVALIEPLARQKGLGFAAEVPDPAPVMETDPNKLRQVLFNLVGNAVKFTEHGEVRLVLRAVDGGVVLEVRDTGRGISPENLERIWEPFWQAGSTRGGTGLGLGIVRRLVRLMGGEVRARSEPTQGSVFEVELRTGQGAQQTSQDGGHANG